jgi:hypothetical protein
LQCGLKQSAWPFCEELVQSQPLQPFSLKAIITYDLHERRRQERQSRQKNMKKKVDRKEERKEGKK